VNEYLVEAVWWVAVLGVSGKIVGHLLAKPRRKEKKP
jgi:hypothetical protein